ncbi:unnamed protein product [Rhizoctonia solani]|nr:unnamed protein product [Rhizoctonia solani]
MPAELPTEILDFVIKYTTTDTRTRLMTLSRRVYSISVRSLYESIPDMNIIRTTQCLLTLSKKPDLAHLVHSFSANLPLYPDLLQAFLALLSDAFGNMTNLRTLSLEIDVPMTINPLNQIACRLTRLSCVIPPEGSYPLSQFLSSQPAIEELFIVCQPDDIDNLSPEALPALKNLTAPLHLLPRLLVYRLSRLSRLCVLDIMAHSIKVTVLTSVLAYPAPPRSMELVIRVAITSNMMESTDIPCALRVLGQAVPYVTSLRMDIYDELIDQGELQYTFTSALSNFPNLKTSAVTFNPTTSDEYIHNSAQVQQTRVSLNTNTNTLTSVQDTLIKLSNTLIKLSDTVLQWSTF